MRAKKVDSRARKTKSRRRRAAKKFLTGACTIGSRRLHYKHVEVMHGTRMAQEGRESSGSTLGRRAGTHLLSRGDCGSGMVADALAKRCLMESGESRAPEDCAPRAYLQA